MCTAAGAAALVAPGAFFTKTWRSKRTVKFAAKAGVPMKYRGDGAAIESP